MMYRGICFLVQVYVEKGSEKVTKISEMSIDSFMKAVKEALHEIISTALSSKVPVESVNTIINTVYTNSGNYSLKMGINKVKSALENKVRAANATDLVGMFVGSRDITGRQMPNKYTLIRSDKKHIEISTFDSQVSYQGAKIDIPVPAGVRIKAEHDPEYDSWSLISLEEFKMLTEEELQKHLSKVAIPISAITEEYAYHKTGDEKSVSARPVVIAGEISRVSPEAVFKEDENGSYQIDHYQPVLCPREMKVDEMLPCFQFLLNSKTRGINSVRCHLSQQRKGTPTILVEDFTIACEEAVKKTKDPEAQAGSVSEDLKSWPVLVVGTVMRYNKSQDKTAQNWVDIGVTGIVDADGLVLDGTGAQKTLPQGPKPTETPSINTESQPVAGPIVSSPSKGTRKRSPIQQAPPASTPVEDVVKDAADKIFPPAQDIVSPAQSPAPASAPAPAAPAAAPVSLETLPPKLNEVAKVLIQYCKVLDTTPADLTIETIKTQMLDVITLEDHTTMPDIMIKKVIEYLKAGGKVL
jgi:hypothetical protein